jgi:hypothetical protein
MAQKQMAPTTQIIKIPIKTDSIATSLEDDVAAKIAGKLAHHVRFHWIARTRYNVGAIAPGAAQSPDLEAGCTSCKARQGHSSFAFWASQPRHGGEPRSGGGTGFSQPPSNV